MAFPMVTWTPWRRLHSPRKMSGQNTGFFSNSSSYNGSQTESSQTSWSSSQNQQNSRYKIKLILPLLATFLLTAPVQSSIPECLARNNISEPTEPLHTSTCCLDTEWLVRDQEGEVRCQEDFCLKGGQVP